MIIQKSKFKNQNCNLKLKTFAFLFVFLTFNFYLLTSVYAVDSTPSADIRSKLEELKKEIASKAATLKQEVDAKLSNKAYIGRVKTKSETSITLNTKNGLRIININQDTFYVSNVKGKKYSQKSIAEDDYIAALGDIDETQTLSAKEVILQKPSILTPKSYLWGEVIVASEKLITLRDKSFKNIAVSIPDQKSVKQNDFIILTGNLNKNGIFEANFVYVIPQGGFIKPKKVAYPTPNGAGATPSAKTKISTPSSGTTKK